MTTTIATARERVKERLLIGSASGEPSDAMIDNMLIDAFKWLIAALPPVREATVEITGGGDAALPTDTNRVFFAARGPKVLFRSEWAKQGTTIVTLSSSVAVGDTLSVFYTIAYTITTTVDTSSIFGNDWLEPAAIVMAAVNAYQRLSNRSASRGGDKNAQMMRAMEAERKELVDALRATWQQWDADMRQALDERRESGDLPVVSRRQGVRNESRFVVNTLLPEWDGWEG